MKVSAAAILALALSAAVQVRAADTPAPTPGAPYREPPARAIVVPACSDSPFRTLMTCEPREETFAPADPALAAMEGTIVPRGKPYGELFTPPRPGEPRRP